MKNVDLWKPSKFNIHNGKLSASANMGLSSRRMANYVASFYTEYIPEHCSGSILDLGCGNAPMYGFYKNFGLSFTCIDWGFSLHNKQHLDVECDLNKPIPIPDNSFDTIILSDVIEHLIKPGLILQEIQRMLRPGGKLLMNYPFMYGVHEAPFDYARYTHFYIVELATAAGLQVMEIVEFGRSIDVIENLVLRSVKKKKGGKFFEKLLYHGFKRVIKSKSLKISSELYSNTPFGYGFAMRKPEIS